jgi:hypothetical protein
MSSLIGSGHTSDFREGSNREFEKSKGGSPTSGLPCGFVLVERRPVMRLRLFAPLRDKVTSSAQSLDAFGSARRIERINPNRTAR